MKPQKANAPEKIVAIQTKITVHTIRVYKNYTQAPRNVPTSNCRLLPYVLMNDFHV